MRGEKKGTEDRSGMEILERRPQGCTITPERRGADQRMKLMRRGAERGEKDVPSLCCPLGFG